MNTMSHIREKAARADLSPVCYLIAVPKDSYERNQEINPDEDLCEECAKKKVAEINDRMKREGQAFIEDLLDPVVDIDRADYSVETMPERDGIICCSECGRQLEAANLYTFEDDIEDCIKRVSEAGSAEDLTPETCHNIIDCIDSDDAKKYPKLYKKLKESVKALPVTPTAITTR